MKSIVVFAMFAVVLAGTAGAAWLAGHHAGEKIVMDEAADLGLAKYQLDSQTGQVTFFWQTPNLPAE